MERDSSKSFYEKDFSDFLNFWNKKFLVKRKINKLPQVYKKNQAMIIKSVSLKKPHLW